MSAQRPTGTVPDWEKEFAPIVTRRQVAVSFVIYAVWLGFLAVLAVQRWFGSLQ
jgi:hypothetical protein